MSVISSWEDHYNEWLPELSVFVIDRKNRPAFEKAVKEGSYDVYIMHWDVVRLMPELGKHVWFQIIADEAHRIGNREAQVTSKSKKIPRRYLIELTGTPCTSKPQQFWSLLNWAYNKRFSAYWRFFHHHVVSITHDASGDCKAVVHGTPCGKYHKNQFQVIIGIRHQDELLAEIAPYYVRRLKEEVMPELPDKYHTRIEVELGPQQRRAYEAMRKEMLAWVGEHEDEPLAAAQAVVKLVRLQQLACAYAEMVKTKVRKRHKHHDTHRHDESNMAVQKGRVGSCYDEDGELICKKLWEEFEQYVVHLTDPSVKLDAVMEIFDANPEKQFVVFSQSKQVINLLGKRLVRSDIPHGLFTGDTPQGDRGQMVKAFQRGDLRIFAGTIQAGGEGITLTAASTVIFLDRSWSPAKNEQAEDRCHRIGQENAVQIIDIVARNTVDLGRLSKLENSWQFIKLLLGDRDAKLPKPDSAYI